MTKNSEEVQNETWISEIVNKLESGKPTERVQACDALQHVLKGAKAETCRRAFAGNRAVPQLLILGQHRDTAKAAMYALQLLAATPEPLDPVKLWMEECGCINTLIRISISQVNSFLHGVESKDAMEPDAVTEISQTISHMLATLVNLCIGSSKRKDVCLQSLEFVKLIEDLLNLHMHRDIQKTAAYLVATMAIGSENRKQILATERIIMYLAILLKPGPPVQLQYQAVVALRAIMHGSLDRQMLVLQQPGIMTNLKDLLPPRTYLPQPFGNFFPSRMTIPSSMSQHMRQNGHMHRGRLISEKDQMEVMIAIAVLRTASVNIETAVLADDECSTPDDDTLTSDSSSSVGGRWGSQSLLDVSISCSSERALDSAQTQTDVLISSVELEQVAAFADVIVADVMIAATHILITTSGNKCRRKSDPYTL